MQVQLIVIGSGVYLRLYALLFLQYQLDEVLSGHSDAVTCIGAIQLGSAEHHTTTIASGASDSTLRIWERRSSSSFQLLQTVSFDSGFVLGVDLHCLYGHLLLACGTDLGNVEILVKQLQDSKASFGSVFVSRGEGCEFSIIMGEGGMVHYSVGSRCTVCCY